MGDLSNPSGNADNLLIQSDETLPASLSDDTHKVSIHGFITDSQGDPLPGATILEEGTENGTVSDVRGAFQIDINPDSVLAISFLGYQTKHINAKNQCELHIVLEKTWSVHAAQSSGS